MEIENKTKQILNELDVNMRLKGYRYWIEAVRYVIENNKTFYSMTQEIYPKIAEKYNDTSSRVERALRHVLESKQEELQQYFKIRYKISNSALLALIVDKIKVEMSDK